MKVLVTGHLGFVGTHLCKALRGRGDKVMGIDLKEGDDVVNCPLPDGPDEVYHLAAQTDARSKDAFTDAMVNVMGSIRIFEKYRDKVVFASSSMVNYPHVPYAVSKKTCEDYAKLFGAGVVRFCNLYGEGGHSVIDKFRTLDRITIYGKGDQVRTYASVERAVAFMLADQGRSWPNILNGRNYTVLEIASWFSGKPVDWLPAVDTDMKIATQV